MQEPDFVEFYRSRSDDELRKIADDWPSLIDDAKVALQAEFSRRELRLDLTSSHEEEEPGAEYRNLVTIRQYRDLSEAIVARGVIQSAGIFCFLKDENFVRLDWQMSNLIGGIRLQVPVDDVEAAEAVLAQSIPAMIALPDDSSFDQPRCPKCNSIDISWERQGRKAALFSLYLFSLPWFRGSESWHCSKCGLRWVDESDPVQAANGD